MMIQTTRRGLCSECQKLNINWNPSPTCSTNTRPLENHKIIPDTFGNLLKTQTFYKLDTKQIVYLRGRRDTCRRSRTFLASLLKKKSTFPSLRALTARLIVRTSLEGRSDAAVSGNASVAALTLIVSKHHSGPKFPFDVVSWVWIEVVFALDPKTYKQSHTSVVWASGSPSLVRHDIHSRSRGRQEAEPLLCLSLHQ